MDHQVDHRQVHHCLAARRQRFIVLAQSSVLAQPCKGAFDNPASGQNHKLMEVTTFDNLHHASILLSGPEDKRATISSVRPDSSQSVKTSTHPFEDTPSSVPVLDIRRMYHHRQDQPQRVHESMAFATFYLLAGIVAASPPFPVLTVWLSRTAALGVGLRPTFWRTCSRRWS